MPEERGTDSFARRGPMRGLLALNVGLVLLLGVLTIWPEPAHAQGQPGARARGEYTMVAGELQFGNSSGVWITDSNNQEIVVVRYDQGQDRLDGIGYIDLKAAEKARVGR